MLFLFQSHTGLQQNPGPDQLKEPFPNHCHFAQFFRLKSLNGWKQVEKLLNLFSEGILTEQKSCG